MPDSDPQIEDARLAGRILAGDAEALRAVYEAYGPKIRGFLAKQFGDQLDDAERDDVFQISLVKLWQKIGTYQAAKGTLRQWWIFIARNSALDRIDGRKRCGADELDDPGVQRDESDSVDAPSPRVARRLERVYEFIHNRLKGHERIVGINCFVVGGDPDIARLAALLERDRGYVDTVKSKVKRKIKEFVLALEHADDEREEVV